ncbi:hypothetical protein PVAP13_9KG142770 [Panicum virgatum]|uniref:Uncharacterized protein n=1 Tax=Panicum virgatum TaxID=38727 RepID=A0A8T0NGE4_PANVG|nr:hypothetical protein PVAP13_9KG142770 [Panicum virgatum]
MTVPAGRSPRPPPFPEPSHGYGGAVRPILLPPSPPIAAVEAVRPMAAAGLSTPSSSLPSCHPMAAVEAVRPNLLLPPTPSYGCGWARRHGIRRPRGSAMWDLAAPGSAVRDLTADSGGGGQVASGGGEPSRGRIRWQRDAQRGGRPRRGERRGGRAEQRIWWRRGGSGRGRGESGQGMADPVETGCFGRGTAAPTAQWRRDGRVGARSCAAAQRRSPGSGRRRRPRWAWRAELFFVFLLH